MHPTMAIESRLLIALPRIHAISRILGEEKSSKYSFQPFTKKVKLISEETPNFLAENAVDVTADKII